MTETAAFVTWLGGSIIVLADGRRGLALGLVLVTAGLAALVLAGGQPFSAAALFAGGILAAVLRFRAGAQGWGLMQPGSTPRIILSIVAGLVALWIAASVATGAGGPMRFALLASIALACARLLQGGGRAVVLTAAAGLALALGAGATLGSGDSVLAACLVAALIAAGASALPHAETDGA